MNSSRQQFEGVVAHYSRAGLETEIMAALVTAGKDPDNLKAEDLAPFDEFHIRGRKATLEMAREISPDSSWQVLDVGSGIGGPSRCLALEFGCRVTGIDLSAEYCQVARMLARCLGLENLVFYVNGNALRMPFEDGTFDLLWTQHMAMNIADKDSLYGEMRRVLKPGGKVAIYDVLQGEGGQVCFPVPWAFDAANSFLTTPQQMRSTLECAGFEILTWHDVTETGRSWFRHLGEKIRTEGPSPLGIQLLLGPDFRQMAQNQVRNLEEGRIVLIETIARRSD